MTTLTYLLASESTYIAAYALANPALVVVVDAVGFAYPIGGYTTDDASQ
jgi:hypothetical protein